jgi:hypothetical protein
MSKLVSLSQVKSYLGKASARTADDTFITSLIEEYSSRFEEECGQPIEQAATSYEWFGLGNATVTLPHRSVMGVSGLDSLDGMVWKPVAPASFVLAGTRIVSEEPFRRGVLYRATIVVGYLPDKIPGDIVTAVRGRVLVEYYDAPAGGDRFGVVSEKEEAGTDHDTRILTYDRTKAAADWSAAVRRHSRLP